MLSSDPATLSAIDLVRAYRSKALSPVEATQACLARIGRWNDRVGAFCVVDGEGALAAARASEQRWLRGEPLGIVDGVPAGIKDLISTRGWKLRRGSLSTARLPPSAEDAPATARLRDAGAVLLGSTTTPEFGWKAVTDNPLGLTARNPWDTTRTAGGSSGGAAAAVALGMGALHVGTDGGGSIRIPASFTGIVGLKPTFGRVPAWPLSPFGTVAHIGPMTRTVEDAAVLLTVLSRPDIRDWHALPFDGADYRSGLAGGIAGLRIAASDTLGFVDVDPGILRVFHAAVDVLVELGARVERLDPPLGRPRDIFARTWFASAARLVETLPAPAGDQLDPGLRAMAEEGAGFSRAEIQDAALERGVLGVAMQQFLDRYDLLVTPATALPAFAAGIEYPDPGRHRRWIDWAGFSYPFNLTQQPAISVPAGFTASGLPVGLQIVGAKYCEALVLRAARAFEAVHPQPMPTGPQP